MYKITVITIVLIFGGNRTLSQHLDEFNVLLIIIDDLNDWTEPGEGHPQSLTPHIARFAKEAITFQNGYANVPICNPSRVSFLTGIRPTSSGVYFNSPRKQTNFSSQELRSSPVLMSAKTISEYFGDNNYVTIGMGKIFHVTNSNQEVWSEWERTYGNYGTSSHKPGFLANGVPVGLTDPHLDWGTTDMLKEFTRDFNTANRIADRIGVQDSNFLAVAGIYRPHLPWYVPSEYFEKFDLTNTIIPEIDPYDLDDIEKSFSNLRSVNYEVIDSLNLKREVVRGYLAAINYADEALGVLLGGLENSRHSSNTIVVIIGDHGWHLGEKLRYKKRTLWEEGTKTTFMIKIPGHPMSGQRIDVPVSLIDLYPTLLELCNLPPNSNLEGESLLPIIDAPGSHEDRIVHNVLTPFDHSIRTKRWRYTTYDAGGEELYDHQNDSLEHKNLIHDFAYKGVVDELKFKLDSILLRDERPIQYPITHHYFPGEIQFEKYDSGGEGLAFHDLDSVNEGDGLIYPGDAYRFEGVDVFPSDDEGGGFYVKMQASEWMEYSIIPNKLETFQYAVRYRTIKDKKVGLVIKIEEDLIDSLHLPSTNGDWATIHGPIISRALEEDQITLRVLLTEGEVDLNFLEIKRIR